MSILYISKKTLSLYNFVGTALKYLALDKLNFFRPVPEVFYYASFCCAAFVLRDSFLLFWGFI
jgi:hypothetical protein